MKMSEYYRKWIIGPFRDFDSLRELAHSIGAFMEDRPGMSRNHFLDHASGVPFIYEWKGRENVYISIAVYDIDNNLKGYPYLYYDFDSKENPEYAIKKGLEFARSIKERYGADPVVYLSGFKGLGIIVPLKEYVDWETYEVLWKTLIQPYNYLGSLVDRQVLEKRRLHRIPYTYNIKKGVRRLSKLIDLDGQEIKPWDFDWNNYEPLDPSQITLYKIKAELPLPKTIYVESSRKKKAALPSKIEDLIKSKAIPPCISNIIETMIKSGDPDHIARLVLVWFLKWIGYDKEQVIEFFSKYAKDYNERKTRYQVEYAYGLRGSRKDYLMPSCRWMKEHGICLDCGWNKNPVTYTYSKAIIPEEIKHRFFEAVKKRKYNVNIYPSPNNDYYTYLETIHRFIRETGLEEFGYEDLRKWLESRNGGINARTWHNWERILRLLAEKGLLGRKYWVSGEWVDIGPGKIEKPPSKKVRFYIISNKNPIFNSRKINQELNMINYP
ncbi:MAG: hypothetical protein J7J82_01915 [Staphylothermus sp.]|nr:hypothetical protein [Staphylothermus sp.]